MSMIENNIVSKHGKMKSKDVILTKKFKHAIYALNVRTTSQMVYMDDSYKYTLQEMITDIVNAIATSSERITINSERLDAILQDAPEEMNTFKEVWEYINVNGDSELAQAIRDRYTKGEIDDLLEEIKAIPNAYIMPEEEEPEQVKDGDIFYHIMEDEVNPENPAEGDLVPTSPDDENP